MCQHVVMGGRHDAVTQGQLCVGTLQSIADNMHSYARAAVCWRQRHLAVEAARCDKIHRAVSDGDGAESGKCIKKLSRQTSFQLMVLTCDAMLAAVCVHTQLLTAAHLFQQQVLQSVLHVSIVTLIGRQQHG